MEADYDPCPCTNRPYVGRVTAGSLEDGYRGPIASTATCEEHIELAIRWAEERTGLKAEFVPW